MLNCKHPRVLSQTDFVNKRRNNYERYMNMNRIGLSLLLAVGTVLGSYAQQPLSLDSCRTLALTNNKDLRISQEKITAAHNQQKAASTNFLPKLDVMGTYMYTQKEISLLSDEQQQTLGAVGGAIGQGIVDALQTDTRNLFAGTASLTQPLYMGGKIRAYHRLTRYAEQLARAQHATQLQEVLLAIDEAYWQVVSLVNRKNLAESYLQSVKRLENDVTKMKSQGMVTKADELSVMVKVNEAEVTLTQVDNGLSLAKMALCQLCGLPMDTPVTLADEQLKDLPLPPASVESNVHTALSLRSEVKSLELAEQMYRQKIALTRSEFLPSVALSANYLITNPALVNGFEKKFRGMWGVGVVVKVPVFHWGEGNYKVRAAKAEARIARYQLDDAKEKIELQVSQSTSKVNEAVQRLSMALKNMEKAEENLKYARLSFQEGVIPTSNVLEAQTAWLSAQSAKIDAQIDVKMSEVYLKKAMGTL